MEGCIRTCVVTCHHRDQLLNCNRLQKPQPQSRHPCSTPARGGVPPGLPPSHSTTHKAERSSAHAAGILHNRQHQLSRRKILGFTPEEAACQARWEAIRCCGCCRCCGWYSGPGARQPSSKRGRRLRCEALRRVQQAGWGPGISAPCTTAQPPSRLKNVLPGRRQAVRTNRQPPEHYYGQCAPGRQGAHGQGPDLHCDSSKPQHDAAHWLPNVLPEQQTGL